MFSSGRWSKGGEQLVLYTIRPGELSLGAEGLVDGVALRDLLALLFVVLLVVLLEPVAQEDRALALLDHVVRGQEPPVLVALLSRRSFAVVRKRYLIYYLRMDREEKESLFDVR